MLEIDGGCDGGGIFEFIDVVNVTKIVPFLCRLHYFRVLVGQVGSSNTLGGLLDRIRVSLPIRTRPFRKKI